MTKRTVLLLLLLAAVLLTATASASAQDLHCGPKSPDSTRMIVLHPGGWIMDGVEADVSNCAFFGKQQYRTVVAKYPLMDFAGSFQYVQRLVQTQRTQCRAGTSKARCKVFVYGESAGASMAAWLAGTGQVDGAVAWAPVNDIVAWNAGNGIFAAWHVQNADEQSLYRYSPLFSVKANKAAPLFVLHGRNDGVAPYDKTVALSHVYPTRQFSLLTLPSDQHLEASNIPLVRTQAMKWFRTQGRRR